MLCLPDSKSDNKTIKVLLLNSSHQPVWWRVLFCYVFPERNCSNSLISSPCDMAGLTSNHQPPHNDPCWKSWRNLHWDSIIFLRWPFKYKLISRPTTCQQILEKPNNASRGDREKETNLINSSARPKTYKSYHFICQPTLWIIQQSESQEGRERESS